MSERKTENLLEQALRATGFQEADFHFQGSLEEEVQRFLPSKRSGSDGRGKPEHIIRLNGDAADILVTECKASYTDHASKEGLDNNSPLKPSKYAEDGVIHYMKGLRREYNVVGLAVSGNTSISQLKISTFLCLRNGEIKRLSQPAVLKPEDYRSLLLSLNGYGQKNEAEIIAFSKSLHEYLRDHMELSEAYKPLIVSGVLLALKDTGFEKSYRDIPDSDDLASAMYEAVQRSLKKAQVRNAKYEAMKSNYHFIKTNKSVKEHLRSVVSQVYRNLFFALLPNSSFDLLGSFYGEFLRYSGGDQQGLGIVLTPRHITELFADLADLSPKDSVVLDTCAGTGGFLIAAMSSMIRKSHGNSALIEGIKKSRIVGIELDSNMFTLACANMIFRGDGKANMFWDDCLSPREADTLKSISALKPNVAMLNPPFSKKSKGKSELQFLHTALDMLQPNGKAFCIVPTGSLLVEFPEIVEEKKRLLEKHTLRAVMSLPERLFPGVGTVAAIVVMEAHRPHLREVIHADGDIELKPKGETWFGYWRDDGFYTKKNKRIERKQGEWLRIRESWIDAYVNQKTNNHDCCKRSVSHDDEWLAEAYLDTFNGGISVQDIELDMKRYAIHEFMLETNMLKGDDDEEVE